MATQLYERIGVGALWPMTAGGAGAIISAAVMESKYPGQSAAELVDVSKVTSLRVGEWDAAEWLRASETVVVLSALVSLIALLAQLRADRSGK